MLRTIRNRQPGIFGAFALTGVLIVTSLGCSAGGDGGNEQVLEDLEPGRGRIVVSGAVEGETTTGHSIMHRDRGGVYSLILLAPPNHVVTLMIPDDAGEGTHEFVAYEVSDFGGSGELMGTYSHDPPISASTEAHTGTYGARNGTLTITGWGETISGTFTFDAADEDIDGELHEVHVTGGFREIDLP